jgi:hypothetical protein
MQIEKNIYSRNKICSHVKSIWTCYLILNIGFVLELKITFYVPSFLETWFQFQNLYLLNIPLSFQKLLVYFINLIVLEMIFYLMVFTTLVYKTILLIVQCMFTLALKNILLMRIPLCYGTRDSDISPLRELKY